MTFSTVKVGNIPKINLSNIDGKDRLIINDTNGPITTTNTIEIGDFIGYIQAIDLTFTGEITFNNDVFIKGDLVPPPGSDLNMTVDELTIRQELNLESTVVTGLSLNDLDDVSYDDTVIEQKQVLGWDTTDQKFIPLALGDFSPVSEDKPVSPEEADLWWRKDNGKLYIYYTSPNGNSYWVQASGSFV